MGLAASQARLLTLTSRSIDLQLQCMRYSAQEIRNAQTACELSEEHNEILDELSAAYKAWRNGDTTTTTTGGYNPDNTSVTPTTSQKTVNLTNASWAELTSYNLIPRLTEQGELRQKGSYSDPSKFDVSPYIHEYSTTDKNEIAEMYKAKAQAFFAQYGTNNFQERSVEESAALYRDKDFLTNCYGISEDDYKKLLAASLSSSDPTERHVNLNSGSSKLHQVLESWGSPDHTPKLSLNEKNFDEPTWKSKISTFDINGLSVGTFRKCVENGGSISASDVIDRSAHGWYVDYLGKNNLFSSQSTATSIARQNIKSCPDYTPGDKDVPPEDVIGQATKDAAKLWEYILNGDIEVVSADGTVCSDLSSVVVEGSFDGEAPNPNPNSNPFQSQVTTLTKEEYEEAVRAEDRRYENEEKKLQVQDKKLSAQMSQAQTLMNAVNTEIESVKSLIKNNTEKAFTYGYNA